MFENARQRIVACERKMAAIRAKIDTIEADVASREDMKPWLKR
jgi:multidrug resistance efflux pump